MFRAGGAAGSAAVHSAAPATLRTPSLMTSPPRKEPQRLAGALLAPTGVRAQCSQMIAATTGALGGTLVARDCDSDSVDSDDSGIVVCHPEAPTSPGSIAFAKATTPERLQPNGAALERLKKVNYVPTLVLEATPQGQPAAPRVSQRTDGEKPRATQRDGVANVGRTYFRRWKTRSRTDVYPEKPSTFTGKGSKYVAYAGPFAMALDHMEPLPPTGHKRAQAGLADVPLLPAERKRAKEHRAARALTSLLSEEAAAFVLCDPLEQVAARPPERTAEQLTVKLAALAGETQLNAAYGTLGAILEYTSKEDPEATTIGGSHVNDYLAEHPPSLATITAITWLRDHCGMILPSRAATKKQFSGRRTTVTHEKQAFTYNVMHGFEVIATTHPNACVAGHAAGWWLLAKLALRREQSTCLYVNAIVDHTFRARNFKLLCASVQSEKNPDRLKMRPRGAWGCVDPIDPTNDPLPALQRMLESADVPSILRDTDSPNGNPTYATRFIAAGITEHHRAEASLHALLAMDPIGMSTADAASVHGHAAKRFPMCVCEASTTEISPTEANELARFSGSILQQRDLEPTADLMQRHSVRSKVMPAIYADKAKVVKVLDIICKVQMALEGAHTRAAADPMLVTHGDASWGSQGPFAVQHAHTALLTHASETTATTLAITAQLQTQLLHE